MIGQLTGLVGDIEPDRCLVDVNGVGYVVFASTRTLEQLPHPPEVARVLIETIVREDAIQLFGFADAEERSWFRLLTTVQGVGSRVALGILSVNTPSSLWQAVTVEDKLPFTQASGVGPRLATRLLTELKSKVAKMPVPVGTVASATQGVGKKGGSAVAGVESDALLALEGLGFKRAESWPIVSRLLAENKGAALDLILRLALKELA
ncbi:Holliday junction branch migration protein RuvA [Saccharibacter floricola]|uniref:Holliday junction branch migration complex subunit RuvA n=1 Tax=Saccharibacter floricola DSM 15669 TaxID=1123227 RepID=A0ABQ0NX69_9PROT|nr:Holliday junction branch migration protein RuvA [Saccharibacter floricola]GBQ05378.1 Holliday junction DNA helicase RuvA [Saccharibacter floricola DSM 15669]